MVVVLVIPMLASCAPRGFYRDTPPIVYIGHGEISSTDITTQFPDLNIFDHYLTSFRFIFNGQVHTIEYKEMNPWGSPRVEATVFQDTDMENEIGQFVEVTNEWRAHNHYAGLGLPFLLKNYLYYDLGRAKEGFHFSDGLRALYFSNEYYRFNLDTGANEKITLTQYVEALQQIDINWAINPNYRGER